MKLCIQASSMRIRSIKYIHICDEATSLGKFFVTSWLKIFSGWAGKKYFDGKKTKRCLGEIYLKASTL